MTKNITIAILLTIVTVLAGLCLHQKSTLNIQDIYIDAADRYIKELQEDYPDYLDTTSGTDAYVDYYDMKGYTNSSPSYNAKLQIL